MERSRQLRRLALTGVSAVVSLGCLALLIQVSTIDTAALRAGLAGLERDGLLAAAAVALGVQIFGGPDRFRRLLGATGHALPYRTLLAMRLGAGPLRLLTPLKAGGLADIAFLHRRHGVPASLVGGCLAYDRVLNLIGLLVWLLVGLGLAHGAHPWAIVPLVLATAGLLLATQHSATAALLLGIASRLHPRASAVAQHVLAPVAATRSPHRLLLLAYAIAYQASPFLTGWILARAAGLPLGLVDMMVGVNGAMLAAQLPGPLAGVGPREATLVYLLRGLGPPESLLVLGLALSFLISVLPLILGTPWTGWYLAQVVAPQTARSPQQSPPQAPPQPPPQTPPQA